MTVVLGLLLALVASSVGAGPIAVRFPEGVAHGFVVLRRERGEVLAHDELVLAPRGEGMERRLVFRFADGSLYDETVTFSQKRVYRLLSYKLIQKGPSFTEASEISFDRSGRYRALTGNDEPVEGVLEVPDDVHNGITGCCSAISPSALRRTATLSPSRPSLDCCARPCVPTARTGTSLALRPGPRPATS